jgi:hypothetical protein
MAAAVLGCRVLLERTGASPAIQLGALATVGILAHGCTVLIVRPPALADFLRVVPVGRRKGS